MRTAATILGVLGGVFGLLISFLAGSIMSVFGQSGFGLLSIGFAIAGVVGGALSSAKPKLAAVVMIVSAGFGFLEFQQAVVIYVIPGALLVVGALLSLQASPAADALPATYVAQQ